MAKKNDPKVVPEVQQAGQNDTIDLAEMSKVNQGQNTNQNQEHEVPKDFDAAKFIEQCGSKSAAIRQMAAQGMKRGPIAKALGIRYQHVRNVLLTPVKKKDIPVTEDTSVEG